MKTEKESKQTNPTLQKRIYLIITGIFMITAVVFVIIFITMYNRNIALKAQETQVIEKYNDIAKKHENLVDQDYASVYFDGNNVYIPSENIIIKYQD